MFSIDRFSKNRFLYAAMLLISCLGVSCGDASSDRAEATSGDIYTTFYPTTYFAERLTGGDPKVVCPLPEGADPIFWNPPAEALESYQKAALIIRNGAEFEKWMETVSLPSSRLIDTAQGFHDQFVTYESRTHSHGAEGEHSHEGVDGHTWVDPILAKRQAEAILSGLNRQFGEQDGRFAKAYQELCADLDGLDQRFRALGESIAKVQLFASHPAYNYVAKRYGWSIHNLDLDPEAALDDHAMSDIRAHASSEKKTLLLWESEPLAETASNLKEEFAIESILFTPAESLSPEDAKRGADYLSLMNENLERLEKALATE